MSSAQLVRRSPLSARELHAQAARRALELVRRAATDPQAAAELRKLRAQAPKPRADRACIIGLPHCPICGTGIYAPGGGS